MRKGLLALILMVTTTSTIPAQEWAEKMFTDGKLTHDFDNVAYGSQLSHSFTITNIYSVRMEITRIAPSSGCVTALGSKRILGPGDQATIEIQMDARRFIGPRTQSIEVTVGPERVSTAMLRVTANSRLDLVFNPGRVSFGTVAHGQTPCATVDVEYAGKLAWQVSEARTPKEAPFVAEVKEIYRRPGEVGYQVKVTLKPDAVPGPFQEFVYLKTNDPNAALLPMFVDGSVQSPLSVSPEGLNLGTVKTGETLTRRVVVRGNKPFRVVGIDGSAAVTLGTEPSTTANMVQTVTFLYLPAQAGAFKHEVKIKTDFQDAPVVVVFEGVAER